MLMLNVFRQRQRPAVETAAARLVPFFQHDGAPLLALALYDKVAHPLIRYAVQEDPGRERVPERHFPQSGIRRRKPRSDFVQIGLVRRALDAGEAERCEPNAGATQGGDKLDLRIYI